MTGHALIVGGGMGGLAAAIACRRAGWGARLFEQAAHFSEVGAGIQLGPNSTRILAAWGLGRALDSVAAFPKQLVVRDAADNDVLGSLALGPAIQDRYGSPYLTIHRADLQWVLEEGARAEGATFAMGARIDKVEATDRDVTLSLRAGDEVRGDALIGADGLWSMVREHVLEDGAARPTGHLAYRGTVPQRDLPAALRTADVNVWLAPQMHMVAYPVRGGADLNVVVIVEGKSTQGARADVRSWDQEALALGLQSSMTGLAAPVLNLVQAMPAWRLWSLNDRPPMRGPAEMAKGRIALVGDAAHPMRPYFAQGAGMAIEDARELGRCLGVASGDALDVPAALQRYANARWERAARVQALSRRNGRIFHAQGLVRWGRNQALRMLGERLLDQPWLYQA